jgi:N12 class adenine-specific DNA methylase
MSSKRPRRGYEVQGTFSRLPEFVERPLCVTCVLRPFAAAKPKAKELLAEYLLPPEVQLAISLGKRVARYLSLVSSSEERALELAKRQHSELLTALQAFRAGLSHPPRKDKALQAQAQERKDIVALLSAFSADGALIPELREAPRYSPRYQGGREDILAQALFLYQTERVVTLPALESFGRSLGHEASHDELRASLVAGRWYKDGAEWMPEREYLSGSLWPRYDRAKQDADRGDSVGAAQAAKLLEAISPVTISGIEPDPRLPWIPAQVVRSWLAEFTGTECPQLERRHHWLTPVGRSIADDGLPKSVSVGLGFLNHDNARFQFPDVSLQVDPDTGREESKSDAQSRARLEYEEKALSSFRAFLRNNKPAAEQVAEVYNRTYRGYIEPTYTDFLLPARWGTRFSLRPHQQSGAARLLAHNGGLLAFDVGGGKTLTGIATIARLREEGRAQRPVVIVPNSILFQWLKQFQLALPDYRVLVIGAERYIAQNGVLASKTDTAQQRAAKWRLFQAGGADVVLVSYSMFARVAVRAESRTQFVWNSSPMLKMFGVEMRDDLTEAQKPEGKEKKKPKKASKAQLEKLFGIKLQSMTAQEIEQAGEELAKQNERAREAQLQRLRKLLSTLNSASERERAILKDAIDRWATAWEGEESDPGVFWEDLGIDCLVLDEAQNMKNLWPVPRRSGEEPPKYLGAIEKPSARALEFAIRAFLVRQKNGGSGVYLLSATPAKNSPIEYFSLLSLVDGDAWTRLGITDPDVFIDRYLKIEVRKVIDTDLKPKFREVVIGFMNLSELRDIIFRYAEFRTAEEVGLKLPKVEPLTIKVPMTADQAAEHAELLAEYRSLIKERGTGAKNKALGILMRLALLSIHPELPFAPEVKKDEHRWTHDNWRQVKSASSPKIEACVSTVLSKLGCGHIAFCEPIAAQYWLREVLVAKGVPRERIADPQRRGSQDTAAAPGDCRGVQWDSADPR